MNNNCYEICDWNDVVYSRYDVIESSIGQFTGIFDINGKKIYQGDIIRCKNLNNVSVAEVKFLRGSFGVKKETFIPFVNFFNFYYAIEVIGNIHDNYDLLYT